MVSAKWSGGVFDALDRDVMNDAGWTKKVDLHAALRSMVNDIAKSAAQSGMKPEGLVVELRFSFEEDGEHGLRPVVFLGEQPSEYEEHRLRVTLGANPFQVMEPDAPRRTSAAPPPPPPVPDAKLPAPRIVVPSKPVLKLRKASVATPIAEPFNDEPPAPRAEVELTPGQMRPVVEQSASDAGPRSSLGERVVVFDHQWYHPKRRDFEIYDTNEFRDDDSRESTEVSAIPPEPFEE